MSEGIKLRNKKTGEMGEARLGNQEIYVETDDKTYCYVKNINEFCREWECVEPAEPLIKDEKIRKAVRAWAEAVGTECVEITHSRPYFIRFMSYLAGEDELCVCRKIGQLFDERLYTVAELCGEEE